MPHKALKDLLLDKWALTDELDKDEMSWQSAAVRTEGSLRGVKAVFSKLREDSIPITVNPHEQECKYRATVGVVNWAASSADEDVLAAEENVWAIGEEIRRILKEETASFPADWISAYVEADIDLSNKQIAPAIISSNFIVVIQFQRF
jgi:hypothetical protein